VVRYMMVKYKVLYQHLPKTAEDYHENSQNIPDASRDSIWKPLE